MKAYHVNAGNSPLILAFPHVGTGVPHLIRGRLNENGLPLTDTDWHVDTLYDGLRPDATTVRATFHRCVIDANRDPSGESLYPGRNTTGLIPSTDFDGRAIWRPGEEPRAADVAARLAEFHAPYHAALASEIERVRQLHGVAILYDCHSIRSRIPFLFDGVLPDFNVGTDDGRACSPEIEAAAADAVRTAGGLTHVVNGRFKGGWTTRHYGQPARGVHAIQMELAQSTYLFAEEPPFAYDATKAAGIRPFLQTILRRIEEAAARLKPPYLFS